VSTYGQGSVFRHGRGWWIRFTHGGKQHREFGGDTRAAALEKLKEQLGQSASGTFVTHSARQVTLRDLLAMLAADHALQQRKSKAPTTRVLEYFGEDFRAVDLTHDELTNYAGTRLASGAKPATVKNELAVLGRGFTLAVKARKLAQRPALPTITPRNTRSGFFEAQDIARLLPHLPVYLRSLVEVGFVTGMRRSELLDLQWKDVDWRAGEIRLGVGSTKNNDGRTWPFLLHPRLLAALKEQRERVEAIQRERGFLIPWVFCHDDGRQVAGWWGCAWRSGLKAAGLDAGMLFHDLRRSAVRNLIRAGISEGVAMRLSGHRTRAMLERYNIVSGSDLAAAVERLAQYDGAASGKVVALPKRAKARA
jgi:integrase